MELGVNGLNAKATLGPAETIRLAQLAEELGLLWWPSRISTKPLDRVRL